MTPIRHLLLAAAMVCMAAPSHAQILRTHVQQGDIEGELHEGSALYKAIPYAEAPVGNLRWKAPVEKAPWQGVYRATDWGPLPPQPIDPNQPKGEMSEDCLYLSVQTPAKTPDDKLPVFVMIHGGAFLTGSYRGTQDSYMQEGIIYCSIEYRLGAFGFMCHPELSNESVDGLSGNYGIRDQIMALRWIHDNIAAFGGDPDRITIAGESAGGISVSILCASPECKGLFRGAISESGSSFWPVGEQRSGNTAILTNRSAEQAGREFQQRLRCKNIKSMRKVSFQTIVDSTAWEGFWPVVDGRVIVDDQYKMYQRGEYNDVDILVGTNSDEGALFCRPMPVESYQWMVRNNYGTWADSILSLYPATNETEVCYAMSDIFRDGSFAWGTYAWANLQKQTGKGRVYLYYFDQDSENSFFRSPRGGAIHVAEMPFCYGYSFGSGKMTPCDLHMQQIISRYWINFIKTGDPNADMLPYWAEYEQGQPTVMHMRDGFRLIPHPNQRQMDLFEAFFRAKREQK